MVTGITTDSRISLDEALEMTAKSNEVRYVKNQTEAEAFITRVKADEARWGRVEPEFGVRKVGRQVLVTVTRSL